MRFDTTYDSPLLSAPQPARARKRPVSERKGHKPIFTSPDVTPLLSRQMALTLIVLGFCVAAWALQLLMQIHEDLVFQGNLLNNGNSRQGIQAVQPGISPQQPLDDYEYLIPPGFQATDASNNDLDI